MTKKIIAIDLDDVIADTTEALRLEANKLPSVNLTKEQYQIEGKYDQYYETVWATHKVEHLVSFDKLQTDMAASQAHIRLVKGAKAAIRKLGEKYKIVLVTSRDINWIKATDDWVRDNLAGLIEQVIFVHHTSSDRRSKGDACKEVGASWLIDDNPEHCQAALEVGVKALLFGDYGWNKNVALNDLQTARVKNWDEVLEYFDGR